MPGEDNKIICVCEGRNEECHICGGSGYTYPEEKYEHIPSVIAQSQVFDPLKKDKDIIQDCLNKWEDLNNSIKAIDKRTKTPMLAIHFKEKLEIIEKQVLLIKHKKELKITLRQLLKSIIELRLTFQIKYGHLIDISPVVHAIKKLYDSLTLEPPLIQRKLPRSARPVKKKGRGKKKGLIKRKRKK